MPDDKPKRKRKGERKDGLIQRSLVVGRKQNGKYDRKYFYGRTIAEANQKKEAFKEKLKKGIDVEYANITVSEWIDVWYSTYVLKTKRKKPLSPSTKAGYTSRIKQLKNAVGSMKMSDVRERHLQEALDKVNGKSKDAATKYAGMIRRIFKKAKTNRVIYDNPAEALDTPDGEKGHHRALQRWEVDFILDHWKEHRCGLWAMVMMLTGMRRGELVAQDWKNIDMENRRIKILSAASVDENEFTEGPTKSEAGIRILPICNMLMDVLETIPPEKRTGKLCLNNFGKPVSPTSFRKGWQSFRIGMWRLYHGEKMDQSGRRSDLEGKPSIRKTKVKQPCFDWRTHDMRFTFATALYTAKVPVKAAQYYMGHADIRLTLDLYTQLSAELEKESNIRLVTFLDSWLENRDASEKDEDLGAFFDTKLLHLPSK